VIHAVRSLDAKLSRPPSAPVCSRMPPDTTLVPAGQVATELAALHAIVDGHTVVVGPPTAVSRLS
jgi:hypothetical protein